MVNNNPSSSWYRSSGVGGDNSWGSVGLQEEILCSTKIRYLIANMIINKVGNFTAMLGSNFFQTPVGRQNLLSLTITEHNLLTLSN